MKLTRKANGWEARFRCGTGPRLRVTIKAPDEPTALARAARLRARVDALVAVGLAAKAAELLPEAAAERTERAFAGFERAMRDAALEQSVANEAAPTGPRTYEDVMNLWLSGEIRQRWPNACRAKGERSTATARSNYAQVIRPILGLMPVSNIRLEDAERVSFAIRHLKQASRRRYQNAVRMVMDLACYPLRLIQANPIPRKFVETAGKLPEFSYLYPDEEAQVVGHEDASLTNRGLLAFTARNGLRLGEACGAVWGDVDLQRGTFTLNRNKTDLPRMFSLSEDVVLALTLLRELAEDPEDDALMFPGFPLHHGAAYFRKLLVAAKVDRRDLHKPTGNRRRIRVHDLRATFCTLALANGRSEQWVMDRTGHTTSLMLARYKRAARTASELAIGWFANMTEALKLPGKAVSPEQIGQAGSEPVTCSDLAQGMGQGMGQGPLSGVKKARVLHPSRVPTGDSRHLQDVVSRGLSPHDVLGLPGGPPCLGSVGQAERDPVARRILLDALAKATSAEQWTIADRLSRLLDGEAPSATAQR